MTHWIITLTRNNLRMSQAAIESFRRQDITGGVSILVVDNDSTDSTQHWLASQRDLHTIINKPQVGVAAGWNQALRWVFDARGGNADHALVVNNDAELRPDAYRWLVADGGGFVTCVGSDDPEKIKPTMGVIDASLCYVAPDPAAKRPHPDFSCFMIRRHVWETVGPFDEAFAGAYCEDSDYHLRMHRNGIVAEALELPFYHIGAGTLNTASPREQARIKQQADKNRKLFRSRYGFDVGSEEYYKAFK